MKLFHWWSVQSLADWGAGDVIIMARSLKQAREIAVAELDEHVAKEICSTEPDSISEKPAAIAIRGSA